MLRRASNPLRFRVIAAGTAMLATALALAGCAAPMSAPAAGASAPAVAPAELSEHPGIEITENVVYGTVDGNRLLLDVCAPKESAAGTPRKAILGVHGGSWRGGDKADWRGICQWLASEGFVAFTINYRLAPAFPYPAQIEDVRTAMHWLREPAQVHRYNIDPALVGAFGGSAGGNLVALLGTEGAGPWDVGTRVAAVAELSGPVDLTQAGTATPQFRAVQLSYLGCAGYADCPAARAASPVYQVDTTDPPFFIAHSRHEFIPLPQAEEFVAALRASHVDTTFVTQPGSLHAVAMLNNILRAQIVAFFRAKLG